MKRLIVIAVLVMAAGALFAQTASPPAGTSAAASATPQAAAQAVNYESTTDHYKVVSNVGQGNADLIAKTMESFFQVYNSYFHFDDTALAAKLNVRVFKDKGTFNEYLTRVISSTREDFVYLHYTAAEKSELDCFMKGTDAASQEDFAVSLAHQGFIQFLKSFVSNPPLWIREGFAIFFEQVRYDEANDKAVYKENLAWLETVKAIMQDSTRFIKPDVLMTATVDDFKANLQNFYPQAWALVSFMVGTDNKEYNRLLWDSILLLDKEAPLDVNSASLLNRAIKWSGGTEKYLADFLSFLDSRKTFPEIVNDGIRLYGEKEYDKAEAEFLKATAMNDKSFIPYYYLGLIAYNRRDFAVAESFYLKALKNGADAGITNYALGVNAYVDNRLADAKAYLAAAKKADPEKYGAKADELLAKMK